MLEQTLIIATLLIFLIIGFLSKKSKLETIDSFSTSKNKLGWFPISAGISMTYAGGAALLTMPSLGYTYGWDALVDPIALFAGILIVVFFIDKYRDDNGVTISDLFSGSDTKLSLLIGLVSTFVFLLILAAQFLALFKLISPYFPDISSTVLTLVPALLVFLYVFLGGFSSVTKTDVLQLFTIVFLLLAPIVYFAIDFNAVESSKSVAFKDMPLSLMAMLSLSLIFIPVSQDINIRVKSANSKSNAIKGLLIGAFIYSAIIVASVYMGIVLLEQGVKIGDSEQAISVFFKTYYPQVGIFAILAAMTAIISTLDSYALNTVTALANDILPKVKLFKNTSQKQLVQIAGVIIFVLAISIALYFNGVLALILAALLIYISILIPIAIGKKLRLSDSHIFLSSMILIAIIIVLEIMKIDVPFKVFVYPLIGSILMMVFYLIDRRKI